MSVQLFIACLSLDFQPGYMIGIVEHDSSTARDTLGREMLAGLTTTPPLIAAYYAKKEKYENKKLRN